MRSVAKSVRGYVGVSAETGFRVTAGTVAGLTEIASAYFPRKVTGLQAAYRLREELQGKKVGIVCSGGNVSLAQLKKALTL